MRGSAIIEWALLAVWIVTALVLGWSRLKGRWVFLFACIAGTPFLIYDTYRFGWPEMGGVFHLLGLGCLPLILQWAVRRRWVRSESDDGNVG